MSLQRLINNQRLTIDDHKWGNREIKDWDDSISDVHIDKSTKWKVNGKRQNVRIRIPLNSERDIKISKKGRSSESIPSQLEKEIRGAFEDRHVRRSFIHDLEKVLANYNSVLSDREKVSAALRRLSKHFGLEWTGERVETYVNGKLVVYTEIYSSDGDKLYLMTFDKFRIAIGDIDLWSRHEIRLLGMTKW